MPSSRRTFLKTSALALPGLTAFGRTHAAVGKAERIQLPAFNGSDDEAYWDAIRRLYALADTRVYMNTGGLGPVSYQVLERFREVTTDLQTRSETGHQLIEEAREPVATFLGAKPSEIAFIRNATEGNATIASGIGLKKGDEIIIDASAHPGGAIPWLNQLKARGIAIKTFEPYAESSEVILDRIASLITPKTKVVQVSHITAPTGILLPVQQIAELAHAHNCWFHIDGAQSAGIMPIHLGNLGCDSYATSGHKWLGAMHGTGVLYIREERLDEIVPTEVGAYSDAAYSLPSTFEYISTARRHESGTRNAPLVDSVRNACAFLDLIGMQRVRDRGLELSDALRIGLETLPDIEIISPRNADLRASMLTFRSSMLSFKDLNDRLASEHDFRLRIVTEQDLNAIRVSLHIFNTKAQVDSLVDAVREVLSKG